MLARLPLRGDETVLDAGCGSGRVTRMLLDRLPRGHVVAVDSTASMVEHAREALDPERATVFQADLTELELDEPVDAAFSNAVFHWIPDHDAALRAAPRRAAPGRPARRPVRGTGKRRALPRGREPSVAAEEPYAEHLAGWQRPWHFAGAEETAERLERAGFTDIQTWLEPYPITPPDPAGFLRRSASARTWSSCPEELRDALREAVCERCGTELDYVRLNIDAKKPPLTRRKLCRCRAFRPCRAVPY